MRDNRGVNRMVEVLNSGIDTGSSSNLVTKSTPVDGSVLKERNTNDQTSDSVKIHGADAKDGKSDDDRERKSNAQSASELNIKRSISHQSGNDLMINLDLDPDLDEIDYDEKCAKALTSEGDNDSQNTLGMDVDEPSENLYVSNTTRRSGSTAAAATAAPTKTDDDDIDDPVTIESEEESISKSNAPHESKVVVNGISGNSNKKGGSSSSSSSSAAEDADKETKSVDDSAATKTTNKSNKRKISISSDDEQAPPAKK